VEAFVGCWIEGFHFYIHFDWIEATTKQKILLELKRFFFSLSIISSIFSRDRFQAITNAFTLPIQILM
jgi:hypothetical protein